MKFFRMSNGDIVTSIRPVTGTPGIKATRVYDSVNACYCFEERSYRGSLYNIQHRLKTDASVCLTHQLNKLIKASTLQTVDVGTPDPDEPWYNRLKNAMPETVKEMLP